MSLASIKSLQIVLIWYCCIFSSVSLASSYTDQSEEFELVDHDQHDKDRKGLENETELKKSLDCLTIYDDYITEIMEYNIDLESFKKILKNWQSNPNSRDTDKNIVESFITKVFANSNLSSVRSFSVISTSGGGIDIRGTVVIENKQVCFIISFENNGKIKKSQILRGSRANPPS